MRTIRKRMRDAQRAFPLAQCGRCGGELYEGAAVWYLDGRRLCEDCAAAWLLEEFSACRFCCGEVRG